MLTMGMCIASVTPAVAQRDSIVLNTHLRGRLPADSAKFEGYVRATRGDTLILLGCPSCDSVIAIRGQILNLEIGHERSRGRAVLKRGLVGAGIGALIGAVVGAVAIAQDVQHCRRSPGEAWCGVGDGALIPIGAAVVATGGALVGVVWALASPGTTWTPVGTPRRN